MASGNKRSIQLNGKQTSINLEPQFWNHLKRLAKRRGLTIDQLVCEIDKQRATDAGRSSAIRIYLLENK